MEITRADLLTTLNITEIPTIETKLTYSIDDITENIYNEISDNNISFKSSFPTFFDLIEALDKKIKDKKRIKSKIKHNDNLIDINYQYDFTGGKYTNYIFHVGGTGSGKTYNAIESFMKGKGKCIYLAPLRLLAREIYDKLHSNNMTCNLITGEEQIIECKSHTSATIETVDVSKDYDIVVIDEAFMLNNPDRGRTWTNTILNIKANEAHIITNEETLPLLIDLISIDNRQYIINRYERKIPIEFSDTITDKFPDKSLLVSFSRKDVLNAFKEFDNASILYGNLPPEIKIEQMNRFNKGESNICVCTDVIGMGLNLPCEYVIFDDIFKFDGSTTRELNSSEIKQIGGRAGRYGLSDKGFITSTSSIMLDYIKEQYEINRYTRFGYIGLNEDIFSILSMRYKNIKEALEYFKDINVIPPNYKKIIKLEPVDKYLKLYDLNNSINVLNSTIQYKLLNLPICEYTEDYYTEIVDNIKNGDFITYTEPELMDEILNDTDLETIEKEIKKIELYLYLYHHFYDFLDISKFQKCTDLRSKLIDLIRGYFR